MVAMIAPGNSIKATSRDHFLEVGENRVRLSPQEYG